MTLGEKIKQLRLINNITQEVLANKIYVTRNAISKWETDRGYPNIESLKSIAKTFNVSLDYLLNEEEIMSIAIDNNNKLKTNRAMIYAFILFMSYALIGTIMPYTSFNADPTSGLAIFILILPVCYILLAILSTLMDIRWTYVVIASALAISPTYIFFEALIPSVRLGYWGLIYYSIFTIVYFLISKVAEKSSMTKHLEKRKKVFLVLSIGTTLVYLIHSAIECMTLYFCFECSAPWWTGLVMTTFLYIIPVTILYAFYFYYQKESKK